MCEPRCHVLLALLLSVLTAGGCRGASSESAELKDSTFLALIMDIIQGLRDSHLAKVADGGLHYYSKVRDLSSSSLGERETAAGYNGHYQPEDQRVEIVPRDLRMKDKFLKHLTGPLYFSPKCNKHFHRLYHSTRDCTIPAYYKRCARLLTRLAVSPMCMGG